MVARNAAASMAWVTGSTSMLRTASSPSPLIIAAFSKDECACVDP